MEARGIEPLSENRRLKLSTGVDYNLVSPGLHAYSQAYSGVASFIQIKPQSLSLIRSLLALRPKPEPQYSAGRTVAGLSRYC